VAASSMSVIGLVTTSEPEARRTPVRAESKGIS
jgi:hypothetical protein